MKEIEVWRGLQERRGKIRGRKNGRKIGIASIKSKLTKYYREKTRGKKGKKNEKNAREVNEINTP